MGSFNSDPSFFLSKMAIFVASKSTGRFVGAASPPVTRALLPTLSWKFGHHLSEVWKVGGGNAFLPNEFSFGKNRFGPVAIYIPSRILKIHCLLYLGVVQL